MNTKYYLQDIDGLRGVAVILVLLFHAFPKFLTGGFIGVDVFFVISGYLISRIIIDDLKRNNFSFIKFYSSRIRRIFPSLIVVLIFTLLVGCCFLSFNQLSKLAESQFFATIFLTNFFIKKKGYFDDELQIKPLLHLWSLAVEQQFYLFFPPIIFLAWRKKISPHFVILLIFLISFFASIINSNNDKAFFITYFRMYEIMLGALVLFFEDNKNWFLSFFNTVVQSNFYRVFYGSKSDTDRLKKSWCKILKNLPKIFSNIGLLLIVISSFIIDQYRAFPSLMSLMPAIGSVLVIFAANQKVLNGNLIINKESFFNESKFISLISKQNQQNKSPLSLQNTETRHELPSALHGSPSIMSMGHMENKIIANKILVWFGLISYPLYLWHWPLFSLAKMIFGIYLPFYAILFLLIVSVFLAWLSSEFIEKPFRFGKKIPNKTLTLSLGLLFVSVLSLLVFSYNNFSRNFEKKRKFLHDFKDESRTYINKYFGFNCDFSNKKNFKVDKNLIIVDESCYKADPSKEKRIFLWGDCNAQQLKYGLQKNLSSQWQIMQIASSSCSPKIIKEGNENYNYCTKSNYFALKQIKELKPDFVIVAQYQNHSFDKAKEIAIKLKSFGVKKIIFIGPTPHWQISIPELLITKFADKIPQRSKLYFDQSQIVKNELLRKKFISNGFDYVDVFNEFCNDQGCLFTINDKVTSFDNYHLTDVASDYLVKNLLVPKLEN